MKSDTWMAPGRTDLLRIIVLGVVSLAFAFGSGPAPSAAAQEAALDCTSFASYEEANDYYAANPDAAAALDDDSDGQACEVYFGLESRTPAAGSGDAPAPTPATDAAPEADGDLDCEDFATQEEAQAVFDADPADPNNLDPNRDGIACALLPSAAELSADAGDVGATENNAQTREERRRRRNQDANQQAEDVVCADFATAEDAQAAFDADPVGLAALDDDGDGIVCEDLPSAAPADNTQDRQNRRANRRNREETPVAETPAAQPTPVAIQDIDCIDFDFQEEAQAVYDQDPSDPYNLDPNGDGFACSSLPFASATVVQVPRTGSGVTAGANDNMAGLVAVLAALSVVPALAIVRRLAVSTSRR